MPTAKDVTAEISSPGDPELLTKAPDSRVQPPALLPPSMLLPNGKVSIYHLVQRGLLREGSVLTYNQHYIAKVTAQGRLIPDWTRLPPNFIHPIGEQLMGDEYETPSAWATAVCKITRAQAKAQRNLSRRSTQADENSVAGPAAAPATQATPAVSSNPNDEQQGAASILTRRGSVVSRGGKMTEGRVAVNGWTACRVRLENTDPLRELGEHLLEAEGVPFDKSSRVIEVTIAYLRSHLLELLQKELRASHSASRKNSASSASTRSGHKGDGGRPSPGGGSGSSSSSSNSSSSSSSSSNSGSGEAGDGSAVSNDTEGKDGGDACLDGDTISDQDSDGDHASKCLGFGEGLGAGFVKQRRAAAAAADAIAASVHGSGAGGQFGAHHGFGRKAGVVLPSKSREKGHVGQKPNRKRKLSIASGGGNAPGSGNSSGLNSKQHSVKAEHRGSLSGSDALADEETRSTLEKFKSTIQRLKAAKDTHPNLTFESRFRKSIEQWLESRHARRKSGSKLVSSGTVSYQSVVNYPELMRWAPDASVGTYRPLYLPSGPDHFTVCVLCGSGGADLLTCDSCAESYHSFCLGVPLDLGHPLRCPACSACQVCHKLDPVPSLLCCNECGQNIHATCSSQQDISASIKGSDRWVCDVCLCCTECGVRMTDLTKATTGSMAASGSKRQGSASRLDRPPSAARTGHNVSDSVADLKASMRKMKWGFDFRLCGVCSDRVEQCSVCPLCRHTYSNDDCQTPMICCDGCLAWVHAECDDQVTESVHMCLIEDEDAPYACPYCREERTEDQPLIPACLDACASPGNAAEDCGGSGSSAPLLQALTKPKALRSTTWPQPKRISGATATNAETEMAGLLLCLTRSDIRFENPQAAYTIEELEGRFVAKQDSDAPHALPRWCVLCGLHGDSHARGKYSLGRLLPFELSNATQWVHVECVAWAWGPRTIAMDQQPVRFSGITAALQHAPASSCSLCRRPGATIRCCAPVQCSRTSYHLPCLIVATVNSESAPQSSSSQGATTEQSLSEPVTQYAGSGRKPVVSLAWRRALCPHHAPEFKGYLPTEGSVTSICYAVTRASVDSARPPLMPDTKLKVGTLYIHAWGSVVSVLRQKSQAAAENHAHPTALANRPPSSSTTGWKKIIPVTADFPHWALPLGIVCDRYVFACGCWLQWQFRSVLSVDRDALVAGGDVQPYSTAKVGRDIKVAFVVQWQVVVREATKTQARQELQSANAATEQVGPEREGVLYTTTAPSMREVVIKTARALLPQDHPVRRFAISRPYQFVGLNRQVFGEHLRTQVVNYRDLCTWAEQARNKNVRYENIPRTPRRSGGEIPTKSPTIKLELSQADVSLASPTFGMSVMTISTPRAATFAKSEQMDIETNTCDSSVELTAADLAKTVPSAQASTKPINSSSVGSPDKNKIMHDVKPKSSHPPPYVTAS